MTAGKHCGFNTYTKIIAGKVVKWLRVRIAGTKPTQNHCGYGYLAITGKNLGKISQNISFWEINPIWTKLGNNSQIVSFWEKIPTGTQLAPINLNRFPQAQYSSNCLKFIMDHAPLLNLSKFCDIPFCFVPPPPPPPHPHTLEQVFWFICGSHAVADTRSALDALSCPCLHLRYFFFYIKGNSFLHLGVFETNLIVKIHHKYTFFLH